MTVLVGVLCSDAAVVGSDSSATFSAGTFPTIEQPVKKTFVIEPDVLLACTGSGGLAQRFQQIVRGARQDKNWSTAEPHSLVLQLCKMMLQDMAFTHLKPGGIGALVAFPTSQGVHLCEFAASDFQPEFKDTSCWFVSMGSGQPIADPFFGLLRRTLFSTRPPTLSEARFAAHWTLAHAIDLNTGGIQGPEQIGVLSRSDPSKPYEAKLLTPEELDEHKAHVTAIENHLAAYRQMLSAPQSSANLPPEPPSPKI